MNIKKSISSIVLSLLLLITFLGGCAPKNQPSGITPENETYASRTAGIDFSDEIDEFPFISIEIDIFQHRVGAIGNVYILIMDTHS